MIVVRFKLKFFYNIIENVFKNQRIDQNDFLF